MSDDKVEQLQPGKSLSEVALNKLFEQKKKDKKTEIDKQAKVLADAHEVFVNAHAKLKDLEEEYAEIGTNCSTLISLGLK